MSSPSQTVLALLLVAAAAGYLVLRWARNRRRPGCGSGCCPTDPFKAKLKR